MKAIRTITALLIMIIAFNAKAQDYIINNWEHTTLVDDFGDPSGDTAYTANFRGKFNNSATFQSEASIVIQQYDKFIAMYIYEYRSRLVPLAYESNLGQIRVKRASGYIETYRVGYLESERAIIISHNSSLYKLISSGGEEIKIVIDSADFGRGNSTYLFTIKTRK